MTWTGWLMATTLAITAMGVLSPPLAAQTQARGATPFYPDVLEARDRFTLTPGFSPDGQTMYFAQTECLPIWDCPQRIKRSVRTPDGWGPPELLPLPRADRADYPSVTPDGRTLLFSWQVTHPGAETPDSQDNFDLWSLDLTDPDARPQPVTGPDLNRVRAGRERTLRFVHNETQPTLTRAGDLYFWSERLDGAGDRDVYVARADGRGGFLAPELLPAPINSASADDGAWVSPDGRVMFITYSDRGGCGGSDLFVAYREDGVWSAPQNLGCDINSPYNELAASLVPGTSQIVFPSDRPREGAAPGAVQLWTAEVPIPR